MPQPLIIAIEGPGADLALAELLALPGIQGDIQPTEESEATKEGVLAAIGAIVGIVGGVATIVDKIIAWREKWKKAAKARHFNVIIQDTKGNRLALNDATPEQIVAALQTIAS